MPLEPGGALAAGCISKKSCSKIPTEPEVSSFRDAADRRASRSKNQR